MKKLNYLILGLAGLTLASCSNEDLQGPAEGTYQLTVNLPKDMATRAIGDDITAPQTLNYTLFEVNGETTTPIESKTIPFANGATSMQLNLPLVKGQSYKITFFSQSTQSTEVYKYNEGNVTVYYDNMTYGTGVDADAYDCFSASYETGKVDGALSETVTLTRPVAQINWGTNDLTSAAVQQAFGTGATNLRTTLTATVPSTFDILNDTYGDADKEVEFPVTALPTTTQAFPVSGYDYLAMQYVLADASSDLTLTVSNIDANSTVAPIKIEVPSAPLQANYRTNIYGGLLTDQANFNVTLSTDWGVPSNNISNGAVVEVTKDGTFTCTTPVLPAGVTQEMMKDQNAGAVAVGADGQPYYVTPASGDNITATDIQAAIKKGYNEFYFARNVEIPSGSHIIQVPENGLTIHGNGATLIPIPGKGGEHDISIETKDPGYSTFIEGSTVNVNVENLNGVKIWGTVDQEVTVNVNLTNCSYTDTGITGTGSFVMVRGDNYPNTTININANNCYVQEAQVGIHDTYKGILNVINCKFTNVGIPVNIAKKETENLQVNVLNCIFDKCGIPNSVSAWDYAAPVRVVDNAGPANSIDLLVKNCTFTGTLSDYNILLWDYRSGKVSYQVNYKIENCTPADPSLSTITKSPTTGTGNPNP